MKEYITEKFKREKHVLRYLTKLVFPFPTDEGRKFMISFYIWDFENQVYELLIKNNDR